ncbi:MAG TPA: nucleotidyltransferase domain-containing protein [Alphaproteobacteria bacterium]|nr:nucleotidyltransferase domain-containing protein [Alphaproteobacteria bacterium]
MTTLTLPLPTDAIWQFCRRWKIRELALFGSVLRTDFRPDSDIDVLVTFNDDADWGLLAHIQMQQELASLLNRPIDLLSKRALERSPNWVRREAILNTAQVIVSTDEAGDGPR